MTARREPSSDAAVAARRAQIESLSTWLDTKFRIPGTNVRFGADAVAGLLPGVGDAAGVVASVVVIAQAMRLGARGWTLARMVALAALDGAVGTIPIAGTIFDVVFKANTRNVDLLRRHVDDSSAATAASRRSVLVTGVVICAVLLAMTIASVVVVFWLLSKLV